VLLFIVITMSASYMLQSVVKEKPIPVCCAGNSWARAWTRIGTD
jgi:hypothetical protein